ncbi:MAG: hypothetical protein ACLQUZ_05880 [Rhizomicrobium sp.]
MDTDQIISELTEHAAKAMAEAVRNAFEHGRKMGREEAREDARLAFEEALNKAFEKQGAVQKRVEEAALRVVAAKKEEDGARAKRGSARPLVLSALVSHGPITAKDLAVKLRGQLEENTVRGTLNRLRHDGEVEKRGELWLLKIEPSPAPADNGPDDIWGR